MFIFVAYATNTHRRSVKMQFTSTVFALVGALAASASAQYDRPSASGISSTHTNATTPRYGSNATVPAVSAGPTGTGSAGLPGHGGNGTMTTPSNPGSTGYEPPTQWDNGAIGLYASSGLGLLVAGGVVLAL